MHTVEMLEAAVALARQMGYGVRQEWLGGGGGGGCELYGRKVLFVDLGLGPEDQLDQVLDTLRRDPDALSLPMARQLRELLSARKSA